MHAQDSSGHSVAADAPTDEWMPAEGADDENQVVSAFPSDTGGDGNTRRGWLPLIGFGALALFLVSVSFIWFVNPYPPLKDLITGLFSSSPIPRPGNRVPPASEPAAHDRTPVVPSTGDSSDTDTGLWHYYLQVASRKELAIAQRAANVYRRQGIATVVEGEYIRKRKATFYRVRLGPYESLSRVQTVRDSLRATIPVDAFVDSVRREYDARSEAPPTILQPEAKGARPRAPAGPAITSEPARGFAVKVASHRARESANATVKRLAAQGYPAFLSTSVLPSGNWYRVYVGPFSTRADADRYSGLLRESIGGEVYTVEFGEKVKGASSR